MDYRIEKKGPLRISGLSRRISSENGQNFIQIPEFWNEFSKLEGSECLLKQVGPLGLIGVCYNDCEVGLAFDYMIGIETPVAIESEQIQILDIPETKWAIFTSKGKLPEAIQSVWAQIFDDFFLTTSYRHASLPELEVYPEGDTSDESYTCEIWIPIMER